VLAFLDLEFGKSAVLTKVADKDLVLSSEANFLVVCKRIEEKETERFNMDIIVS
jgi:hypothetical protein